MNVLDKGSYYGPDSGSMRVILGHTYYSASGTHVTRVCDFNVML